VIRKKKPQPLPDNASMTPPPLQYAEVATDRDLEWAQLVTRKVAKALKRPRVGQAEQLVIAVLALDAIAKGPKSIARDIAVTARKVVG
jgi:hypothetical protein